MINNEISRGDICFVKLPKEVQKCPSCGKDIIENERGEFTCKNCGTVLDKSYIQTGIRPAIIFSNNSNNAYSPTINVLPLTSRIKKDTLPVHAILRNTRLPKTSMVLPEQMRTVNKYNIMEKIVHIDKNDMIAVEFAFLIQTGMIKNINKLAYLANSKENSFAV